MIDNACEWGTSVLLIFSENVGSLVYYTHMFPLMISLFIGFWVFINNPSNIRNKVFFFVTLMFSIWVYFDLILWASPTPQDVIFFWSSIVPIEMLMYLGSIYLVYLFSTTRKDASVALKSLFSALLIPILFFMHTDLNVVGLSPDCDEGAIEGIIIQYMYTVEVLLIFVAAFFIIRGNRTLEKRQDRNKLNVIGIATVIFLAFFSAGNMTLAFDLGPFYEQYKLFGMPVFAAIIAYSFIKLRTFGVKTFITQILVLAVVFILFSTTLLETMETARPLLVGTLILTVFLGSKVVQSVRREIEQREKIEHLASSLEAANERLKELDLMKSEFVSIASHQLRSPLTSIRGYATMLLEGSYGDFSPKAKEPLERIAESSKHMVSSVEDYLNVSRIESGNMKYDLTDFNFKNEVDHVVDELRGVATKKGLLLTYRSDISSQGIVHADIGKTRQALHNLINNSIKYTKRGSIVVSVTEDTATKKIMATISDTGVGMDKETQAALFAKFTRAKDASKTNTDGTGLGLYVARSMVRAMGGDINGQSDGLGKGSSFTLSMKVEQ